MQSVVRCYNELMQLREIASNESEFFLKSVYGPLGEEWPAMSFTQPQLATYLHQRYRPASDFILYTATAGDTTEAEEQRGRLLSVVTIDLTKLYPTSDIVSDESWRWAQDKYPGQWALSFAVLRGWNFDPPPLSASVLPNAYSLMGQYPHRGMVYRIPRDQLAPLMNLPVTEVALSLRSAVRPALTLQALVNNSVVNQEAVRIAALIHNRVNASGSVQTRTAPERNAPATLLLQVGDLLLRAPLCCSLCGGLMQLQAENRLLQPSPDRMDSASGSYGPENFQLAHLGCNLGKNNATTAQFLEWLHIAAGNLELPGVITTDQSAGKAAS